MNKRTKYILIGIALFLALFFSVGGHFINKFHNDAVKSKPQMYCYENFRGLDEPVSVLIIEDFELRSHYLKYYRELEKGEEPYLHNKIPLKGLPQYSPIYVLEYSEDSLLAKVVSYYNRGSKFGGSYTEGWVYSKTLHKNPPPKKGIKYMYNWFTILLIICWGILAYCFYSSIYNKIKLHSIRLEMQRAGEIGNDLNINLQSLLSVMFWMLPVRKYRDLDNVEHRRLLKKVNRLLLWLVLSCVVF